MTTNDDNNGAVNVNVSVDNNIDDNGGVIVGRGADDGDDNGGAVNVNVFVDNNIDEKSGGVVVSRGVDDNSGAVNVDVSVDNDIDGKGGAVNVNVGGVIVGRGGGNVDGNGGAVNVNDGANVNVDDNNSASLSEPELIDYYRLTKPGVTLLVVFTATAGIYLAPAPPHTVLVFASVLAIAAGSAGAAALNMWCERKRDARMIRTAARPLAAMRIAPDSGFVFGAALAILGFILLTFAAGPLAGILLAVTVLFYVLIYTLVLKPRTEQNIVIGGAAGALPPVIGWVVGGGDLLHPLPWILFALVFLWTPPHFWALALPRRAEYAAAKLPMLPVTRGNAETRKQILVYALLLLPAALLPALHFAGGAQIFYAAAATALGIAFVVLAAHLMRQKEDGDGEARAAKRLFRFSIWHLFLIFTCLLVARAVS